MYALQTDTTAVVSTGVHPNDALLHAHSGLRWIVLILLLTSIIMGFINSAKNKPYKKGLYAATMGFLHIQVIIGIIVLITRYFPLGVPMGEIMKNPAARFVIVEHPTMMILAAIIATVGFSLGKRAKTDALRHRRTAVMFTIALLMVLFAIPWDMNRLF